MHGCMVALYGCFLVVPVSIRDDILFYLGMNKLRCRYYTPLRPAWALRRISYFSRKPVNFETYCKRLDKFEKKFPNHEDIPTSYFIDLIKTNRLLQQNSRQPSSHNHNDFLGIITTKSSAELEADLWKVLVEKYQVLQTNREVFSKYLFTNPLPYTQTHRLFELVQSNFPAKNTLVKPLLNFLLKQQDYHSCVKLLDSTYNSPEYVKQLRQQLVAVGAKFAGGTIVFLAVEWFFMPLLPLYFYGIFNSSILLFLGLGLLKVLAPKSVGRISWRPYNSLFYNYFHRHELLMFNRILTHFEEHNEVTIRNFHHSKVRKVASLKVFNLNDYVIELLNSNNVAPLDPSTNEDDEMSDIQQFFRQELSKRKLLLGDLQEELMFLEFWLTHGENFVWVEPDQDPAELIKFINH